MRLTLPPVMMPGLLPAPRARFGGLSLAFAPYFETPPADAGAGGGGAPRTFTQTELDEIISERLKDERKRISKRYEGLDPDEFQRLKSEDQKRKQKDAEAQQNYEAALKSAQESWVEKEKGWGTERESLVSELKTERIRNRLLAAASEHKAVNASQIADLLDRRIKLGDDRQPIVLDEHGQPAFKEGKALTIDQLVSDYLDRNPHLAASSGTTGAGADGGSSTSGTGNSSRHAAPDLKKAQDDLARHDEQLKGRRPNTAELAVRQKLVRRIKELEAKGK